MAQKRLNEEFLEGIYEVYSTLMTNQIFLKLLDEDSTDTNVYEETTQKIADEVATVIKQRLAGK